VRTPKRKERKKSSGSPLFWVARESRWSGSFGVIALAGCRLRELAAATPVPDPRVAGLPIAQEVQIIADDEGQANNPTFDTTAVSGKAGEVIEFTLVNDGSVAHNLSVSGRDKEFGTTDDFTMNSLNAGEEGTLLVKINDPGTYPFRCDLHPFQQTGTLILS